MSEAVIIRAAAVADLPALHALIERAYRGDAARAGWTHEADLVAGTRLEPGELAAALVDPAVRLLSATVAGEPVGCVRVTRCGPARASLGLLTVDPARQAGGLGARLLASGEAAARALDTRTIELTVIDTRTELIAWYERRGYRPTGERRPFAMPALRPVEFVVLEWTLD